VCSRIEAVECLQVGKHQRQRALQRAQAGFEQALDGPGAAEFVTVHQRGDHHVASGHARVEAPDAFGSGISRAPGADVGGWQVKLQCVHSSILANSTILVYLAISAARSLPESSLGAAT